MLRITSFLILLITSHLVAAASYEWTSGWGMGISEYQVDDGNDNSLLINCPDYEEDGYVRAYAVIKGKEYSSKDGQGFDVIIDGEHYSNPFDTDCRVCGANFRNAFWEGLRNTNYLKLSADGVTIQLPTRNLQTTLPRIDNSDNTCRSAW